MSRDNALLKFLEPVLANGTQADIVVAKKLYRKIQQAAWIKEKRSQSKSFQIYLSSSEHKTIEKAAQAHDKSKTAFIKEAALAYTRKRFVIPNAAAINEIRSLLAANYNALSVILEAQALPQQVVGMLSNMLIELEVKVLSKLEHPKLLAGDH